jgi:hypothetical protein
VHDPRVLELEFIFGLRPKSANILIRDDLAPHESRENYDACALLLRRITRAETSSCGRRNRLTGPKTLGSMTSVFGMFVGSEAASFLCHPELRLNLPVLLWRTDESVPQRTREQQGLGCSVTGTQNVPIASFELADEARR